MDALDKNTVTKPDPIANFEKYFHKRELSDFSLQAYVDLKKQHPEIVEGHQKPDYIKTLEREYQLLTLSTSFIAKPNREALIKHRRQFSDSKEEPKTLDVHVPGDSRAFTVLIELKQIEKMQEDLPYEDIKEKLKQAHDYLISKGVEVSEHDKDIIENARLYLRDKIMDRLLREDLGGVIEISSSKKITGAVGNPEDKDFTYTLDKFNQVVTECNSEIAQMFGIDEPPDSEKHNNLVVTISKDRQRTRLNRLANGVYTNDFPMTNGAKTNPLVLVNNAAVFRGKNPSQIMIVEPFDENKRYTGRYEEHVNEAKGTHYVLTAVEMTAPTPDVEIDQKDDIVDYTIEEMNYLSQLSIDSYFTPDKIVDLLEKTDKGNLLKKLLGNQDIRLFLRKPESHGYVDALLAQSVWSKPDISGFSKLTSVMEGMLGIPVQEVTYPMFSKLIGFAHKCGAVIDKFSGDAEEALFLPMESLQALGLDHLVHKDLVNLNQSERSIIFSLGSRGLFKGLLTRLKREEVVDYGNKIFGISYDEVDQNNVKEMIVLLKGTYPIISGMNDNNPSKKIYTDIALLYSLAISQVVNKTGLGLKAVSSHEGVVDVRLSRLGGQVVESLEFKTALKKEAPLERRSRVRDNSIVITEEIYNELSNDGPLKNKFKKFDSHEDLDGDGKNDIYYYLPLLDEEVLQQKYFNDKTNGKATKS